MNLKTKDLFVILDNMGKLKIDKHWVLGNMDKFDLNQKNLVGANILMEIIVYDKDFSLGFNKQDILNIMDKFDLEQQDNYGMNALMYIIANNKSQNLGFYKKDIFNIIDKFDLSQTDCDGCGIYDFFTIDEYNEIGKLSKKELSLIVSKLDIEMVDCDDNNILMKSLSIGMKFNSKKLNKKILNTRNSYILEFCYQHIDQISWDDNDLLCFLYKNNYLIKELNNKSKKYRKKLIRSIIDTKDIDVANFIYDKIYEIKWQQEELLEFLNKHNFKINGLISSLL